MSGRRVARFWLLAVALAAMAPTGLVAAPPPPTSADSSAPPSVAEVEYYTRPLVRARLRIPDSLQGYTVGTVNPAHDEPGRYEVEVRFLARTPFGGKTAHSARFQMKRAAAASGWIVTAR